MKYSKDWLQQEIMKGFNPDYLFFWGHMSRKDGIIDKSCLSQWYPSTFILEGIVYPTAEHWMMVKKAELFHDNETLNAMLETEKPAKVKELGRMVVGFNATVWAAKSFNIVVEGNRHKFSQNQDLKHFLQSTGSKVIVEASPVDSIWGIGLTADDIAAADPFEWKGTNFLGFALMEVRDLLR